MTLRLIPLSFLVALGACTLAASGDAPFGANGPGQSEDADTGEVATEGLPPDPVHDVCERLDACGFLPAGIRRADCEDSTRECLGGALQSEVADWGRSVEACLVFENCFNMLSCYEDLYTCGPDTSGSTGAVDEGTTGDVALATGSEGAATSNDGGMDDGGDDGGHDSGNDGSTGGVNPSEDTSGADDGDPGDATSGDPVPPVCEGTCDACLDCAIADPCLDVALTCVDNTECVALSECYGLCDGDGSCFDQCDLFHPAGIADYIALATCSLDVCEGSC